MESPHVISASTRSADDERLRTIHVVDDQPTQRRALGQALHDELTALGRPMPITSDTKFVWDLREFRGAQRGDIAVCDLYPSGYWTNVPKPTLYEQIDVVGDDIENMLNACRDVSARFLGPLQRADGLEVIVFTHVPVFLRAKGYPDEVNEVYEALDAEGLKERVVEKPDHSPDSRNFGEVIPRVLSLVGGEGTSGSA